jgi:murein DD-endopeptidase MepM/ murein hydrolase activator NlpD
VKIVSLLILSLLVSQTFYGLWSINEVSPAFSYESTEEVQQLIVTGSEITLERESWLLDIQYPVDDYENISSGWGSRYIKDCPRCSGYHKGVDFTPGNGSNVYAAMDGVITQVENSGEYGVHVILEHEIHEDLRYTTVYAHLQVSSTTNRLQLGNNISKGDLIGYVGSTGLSTGPHLHFEIRKNGKFKDPLRILRKNIVESK